MQNTLVVGQGSLRMLIVAVSVGLLSSACGTRTLSDIKADGTAQSLIWPSPHKAVWRPVKPNVAGLSRLAPGMGKTELYSLIGVPHFREGMAGVREWDYVFDLSGQDGPTDCQFKVLFDRKMKAQSYYWQKSQCVPRLAMASHDEEVPASAAKPLPFATFSTDVLFDFGKSALNQEGEMALYPLVNDLRHQLAAMPRDQRLRIFISGHTDNTGPEDHNRELSLRRAKTVAGYLSRLGMLDVQLDVTAHGEDLPIVQCPEASRPERLRCLAPNRRVEVLVQFEPPKA